MTEASQHKLNTISMARHDAFTDGLEDAQLATNKINMQVQNELQDSTQRLNDLEDPRTVHGANAKSKKLEGKEADRKSSEKAKGESSVLRRKGEDSGDLADQFSKRQGNRQYHLEKSKLELLITEDLGLHISPTSTPEQIIDVIRKRMVYNNKHPDVCVVDKTFEFLLEVTQIEINRLLGDEKAQWIKLYDRIQVAKDKHFEMHGIDIQVGQKLFSAAHQSHAQAKLDVQETMVYYRDFVHNPKDIQVQRKYIEMRGYENVKIELDGLRRYCNENLKRSNSERPELIRFVQAVRLMQAVEGVYKLARTALTRTEKFLTHNGIF